MLLPMVVLERSASRVRRSTPHELVWGVLAAGKGYLSWLMAHVRADALPF
jgi:hypothetical protein